MAAQAAKAAQVRWGEAAVAAATHIRLLARAAAAVMAAAAAQVEEGWAATR